MAPATTASDVWSVGATVPELDPISRRAFVEVVAGESGHLAALLAGELPYRLVEQSEEAGVELLPYGGELGSACPCGAWVDPCVHALAVMLQVAWLVDGDPWVLLRLRGLSPTTSRPSSPHVPDATNRTRLSDDLALAVDAAVRAARVVALADDPRAEIGSPGLRAGQRDRRPSPSGAARPRIASSGIRPLCGVELIRPNAAWAIARARSVCSPRCRRRSWAAQTSTYSRCRARTCSRAVGGSDCQSRSWTTISERWRRAKSMCQADQRRRGPRAASPAVSTGPGPRRAAAR